MASMVIEEESGTYTASRTSERTRPHNGYWAGDFAQATSPDVLAAWFAWGRASSGSR